MSSNVKIVLLVSVLFGLAVGIYDFALPYYLADRRISYADMGWIFAISSAIIFVVRIYLGNLSDRFGRKLFYSLALGISSLANLFTPLAAATVPLAGLKSAREGGLFTREVMHPVLLYEEAPGRFLTFIGVTRGMEFFFQGAGTFAAGLLLGLGSFFAFGCSGGLLALAFILFVAGFQEKGKSVSADQPLIGWREPINFDLPRNLKLMGISYFIMAIGASMAHSFIMPLFFSEKFEAAKPTVAVVLMIHRFSLAGPMIFAGLIPRRLFKLAYIAPVIGQGLATSLSAVMPGFMLAAGVWLMHDLIGASLWVPVQHTLIQEFSRPETRGSDVGKTLALGAVGGIIGPFLAGYLAPISVSAPFLVSGVFCILGALPLLGLRIDSDRAS